MDFHLHNPGCGRVEGRFGTALRKVLNRVVGAIEKRIHVVWKTMVSFGLCLSMGRVGGALGFGCFG